jgi:hypothetical protein
VLPGLPVGLRRARQGKKLTEAARLLARGELDVTTDHTESPDDEQDAALAAFGLRLDDDDAHTRDRTFHLWPEHRRVLDLWFRVQTQWRVGMAGPTGLDYQGVEAAIRMSRLAGPRRVPVLLADLQIMERAALAAWAEQRTEKPAARGRSRGGLTHG